MAQPLNQLLADEATRLVQENFTDVRATWWWERRIGGGLAVCQELDPGTLAEEIAERTGRDRREVERATLETLGLEDLEPVVLTFELPGETTTTDAARILAERSRAPEGLAAGPYRQVEEATREGRGGPGAGN